MADNTPVKNASGTTVSAVTDELSDSSQSTKVTMLDGTGSPTPIDTRTGSVAHAYADSGNPGKTGFKATTSLSALTLVASADRTDGFAGLDGVQITRPHT